MSKVKYHKHCRKHEHVKHVKFLLNKALNKSAKIDTHFYFDLTGVAYEDAGHLKFVIRCAVRDLADKMSEEYKRNNEDLTCDFNIETFGIWQQWIAALDSILRYCQYNYPEEIKTDVFQFSSPTAHPEEKKREYIRHYEQHPLIGFNKSFFLIYPDGRKRQAWALTSDVNDLKEVEKIETQYQ